MSFRASFADLREFDRAVFVVAAARFVNVLGSGIVYPFATLYFYGEIGIAFTLVGTGLFANSVATAGGNVVCGAFFDYGIEALLWPSLVVLSLLLGVGVLSLERRVPPAANGRGEVAD